MTGAKTADLLRVKGGAAIRGEVSVPGDKSISHRAIILGALAEGETRVTNLSPGEDNRRTVDAFRAMGVAIIEEESAQGSRVVRVTGAGLRGLRAPAAPIDCGNSGTAMRLLAGVLAGQPFESTLIGDASLSRRPMRRVAEPLRRMGAHVEGDGGEAGEVLPPLRIRGPAGGEALRAIDHVSPVASAQVKSAVLLAGLYAGGVTTVSEPAPSRDHTERMLAAFGAELRVEGPRVSLRGGPRLHGRTVEVPGDLSSAAFWLVAALVTPGGEVRVNRVGVNPTRTGVLDILRRMGAQIEVVAAGEAGGEPVADLIARGSDLSAVEITDPELVVRAIDEFPILCVAAARAKGVTRIRNAAELRAKESDRIAVMAAELGKLGVRVHALPDGVDIEGGGPLAGARCRSHGDHRVAMSLAVAALAAEGETVIEDSAMVATSYPGFAATLERLIAPR
ncbi:MAG: 3-phosphoshikimate 1-carboxyvinyltransferase [Deltaproteobacteria bacterium]|nr:3-phosphoshikimate 1-carboxyvinyltransferase [Deltaproteobacteria bacterium]